ncbi:MAG: hypothetical protein OEX18_06695 [Candidatus Krumholzibacteria bacterium]|nr:hypothetical protein [Candidatus Krumholzibacteria bacterium]MDH4336953.1 hypothetical protein [Candidatus Krumholzibacteria bacterium]MDH5269751.1 hypothetical protein [Candidatus Krumholzibacteria bacterium]MDH5627340.1 hypothetical protein [Candidatus Krumholzibacteria bacterium]
MRLHPRPQPIPVLYACAFAFSVLLAAIASDPAAAQSYGYVTVYADASGASCTLLDDAPRTFNVYVLHEDMYGIVGVDFRLAASDGFAGTYVTEVITPPFLVLGDTQGGISFAYTTCFVGSAVLATVTYAGSGTSAPCSYLQVVAHPDYVQWGILVQNCYFDSFPAPTRGRLYVNPDGSCPPWCVVPTRQTTWGGVKALYRE